MTKLGLEMKLIQSEIDAEADKWNEPQNEIVKVNIRYVYLIFYLRKPESHI